MPNGRASSTSPNLRVGDVLAVQSNLSEALKSYQDGLAIAERLADADSSNAGSQRGLYVGNSRVAFILIEQGEKAPALEALRQGRAIIARLIMQSPNDAQLSQDLASFDALIASLQADAEPGTMQPTR